VKLPGCFHLTVRSVQKHFGYFKASEFRVFLFYLFEPIMKPFMKSQYYDHAMLLSDSIKVLCNPKLTPNAIDAAHKSLVAFVHKFQKLYGEQYVTICVKLANSISKMTANVHNLLHVAHCCRMFGPLWCFSCFPFEACNKEILAFIHGTTRIENGY